MTSALNPRPCCYTDKKDRTWDLSLDFATCRRVDQFDKTAVIKEQFSILSPDRTMLHRILYTDRAALFAIIWAIVHPQTETIAGFPSPKENPEAAEMEFLSGVNGPVMDAARIAISEALGDFFPELRIVLSTWATQAAQIQGKVEQKMGEMNPILMDMAEQEFDKFLAKMKEQLTKSENPGEASGPLLPMSESPTSSSMHLATPSNGSSSLTTPNS